MNRKILSNAAETHPRVSLVLRKSKQGSSMCIWNPPPQNNSVNNGGMTASKRECVETEKQHIVMLTTNSSISVCSLKALGPDWIKSKQKENGNEFVCIKKWTFRDKMTWWPVDVHVHCVCIPGSKQWLPSWRLLYWVIWPYRCGASVEARPLWTSPVPPLSAWRTATYCQARHEERGSKISEKVKRREEKKAKAKGESWTKQLKLMWITAYYSKQIYLIV